MSLNTPLYSESKAPPLINNNKTLLQEDQKTCPECLSRNLIKDHDRAETYCHNCGLVVSMSYPYVGGNRVDNPHSYHYGLESNIIY